MSKIKQIWLNNFKFFGDSKPIELNGKHLLLYGENGSGKSSISYGLHTLLNAATKDVEDVKAQFALPQNKDESLVNIFSPLENGPDHTESFIYVEDDRNELYKISYSGLEESNGANLLESDLASDFVNYQALFRFQTPHKGHTYSLIDVFEYSVFPHLAFPNIEYHGKNLRNAKAMLQEYKNGPGYTTNIKGERILVYKSSPEYRDYLALEQHLNKYIKELIDFINANLFDKIKKFGYDFRILLTYIPASHVKRDKELDRKGYDITMELLEYEGKTVHVKFPSNFLNEAKLTALAFCIRWCVLEYRLMEEVVPNAMKVLVLDDVMISLDRCNRTKLINIILDELARKFQILFFTHDRSIYSYVIKELMIRNSYSKEEDLIKNDIGWTLLEMYISHKNGHGQPILQPYLSPYAKARKYYEGDGCAIDYTACGNELRQAIECAFKNLFQRLNILKNQDGTLIDFDKTMIGDYITLAKEHFPQLQLPLEAIDTLDGIKNFLLNPTSHYNPEMDYYGQELEIAFDACNSLMDCVVKTIVPEKGKVVMVIPTKDGVNHLYTITLGGALIAYKVMGRAQYLMNWSLKKLSFTYSGAPEKVHKERNINLQDFYKGNVEYLDEKYGLADGYVTDSLSKILYNDRALKDYLL